MVRLACINLPALPLQLVLGDEPALRQVPVAVVASERAQAPLLWVNRQGWHKGLRPGMRHAAALSLAGDLRARVVAPARVREAVSGLTALLRRFSPHVEPAAEEPGLFWLSALGLQRLHGTPRAWAGAMHQTLEAQGWRAAVVVGGGHFTCAAAARGRRGVRIFRDLAQEREAACRVPLQRLNLAPQALEALAQLGVRRLGDLLELPPDGLLQRFGKDVHRLHRLTTHALERPLQPQAERTPVTALLLLEPPESDAARLLFRIKGRLPFLLEELRARQEALYTLHVALTLDDHTRHTCTVQPAQPTREERLIVELLRLRLERLRLSAGVVELALEATGRLRAMEQPSLLEQARRRDLAAANRVLAQLRAEYGDQAVLRPVLREGHLPEARFAWEPLTRLDWPRPRPAAHPTLVRRMLTQPRPLADWPRDPARWKADRAPDADGLIALHGPYTISGGWWAREQRRDYYLAETRRGDVLWVYHDRQRGRWFCQGRVE